MKSTRITTEIISNPQDVPDIAWETAESKQTILASGKMLRVIQDSFVRDGTPYAIVFSYSGEIIALVLVTEFVPFKHSRSIRIAICGNPLISANCAVFSPYKNARPELLKMILRELLLTMDSRRVFVTLLKEIDAQGETLESLGFHKAPIEPVVALPVQWSDFDTYLASLKAKYRKKIVRAYDNVRFCWYYVRKS